MQEYGRLESTAAGHLAENCKYGRICEGRDTDKGGIQE